MENGQALPIKQEIENLAPQFRAALPAHVSLEKFMRVVLTAIASDPELAGADRRSLFEAALRCAQDGLLPDRIEAAFVVFSTNAAKNGEPPRWVRKVVYMRMVAGLLKLIRNSGELESISARIVFEKDRFEYRLGDDEKIEHVPLIQGMRGIPIGCYAIARMKGGAVYREFMSADEIEAVKNFSKAKDSGPWSGQFFLEMWKKTVLRRLSKRLPLSTDRIGRDDEFDDDETDITPRESEPVARLRKSLTEYCQRKGGGSPYEILQQIVGHDSFAELNDDEAVRVHKEFESRWLQVEASMS